MRKILFLTKVVEELEYAEQFIQGNLYMNPLSYFKGLEEGADGRGDEFEGVCAIYQPDQTTLTIGDLTIPANALDRPILYHREGIENVNIMCMYAGCLEECDDIIFADNNSVLTRGDQRNLILKELLPRENLDNLGKWSVTITNVTEFQERFRSAAIREGLSRAFGMVRYYDPNTYNGSFPPMQECFYKRDLYSYQNEYRCALYRNDGLPFILSLGDLSDIAVIMPTIEVFENIDIQTHSELENNSANDCTTTR